jgi:hypothetical protein
MVEKLGLCDKPSYFPRAKRDQEQVEVFRRLLQTDNIAPVDGAVSVSGWLRLSNEPQQVSQGSSVSVERTTAPHTSATARATHRSFIFSACFLNFSANSISADLT